MISISPLRYLWRVFEKPFLCNLLTNCTPKSVFFHESKLLSNILKIEIKMPSLSPTMTEGTIVKWLKREGDHIEPGDVLCEIQTDKAIVGLETEEEGVLQKIVIPENKQNIQLGEVIAIISGEEEPTQAPTDSSVQQQEIPKVCSPTTLVGPSVKRLFEEFNIKCSDVPGSGPKHNVLKSDVLKFIQDHNLKPVEVPQKFRKTVKPLSKGAYVDIPISSSKAESAHSKLSRPHGYMSTDCKVDNTLSHIANKNVSLNEFLVKSAATALKRVPKMNNGQTDTISITNFSNGQYEVSFIEDAASLSVHSISERIRECRSTKGAFRISNISSLGISNFIEVISPGDVATLTVSDIQSVFEEDMPVRKMRVTLSFDNYIIGEMEAAEFLEIFKNCLENPLVLMC